jgi:hypothetical protein
LPVFKHPNEVFADAVQQAVRHLSIEDRATPINELQPVEKLDALIFFTIAQEHGHPSPGDSGDLWYKFGFSTCIDEHEEGKLGGLYSRLLHGDKIMVDYHDSLGVEGYRSTAVAMASFEEFWHAYRDGGLIQLMRRYGLRDRILSLSGPLATFLSLRPSQPHPWHGGFVIT